MLGAALQANAAEAPGFSFILLGDLHYDKLSHHDMNWLTQHKAGELGQIRNYSRITEEITPHVFASLRETIASLSETSAPPAFVLQVGDLAEGLCGNQQLATLQNQEAVQGRPVTCGGR